MACRIGITTDSHERKRYWEEQYPSLYEWRILERYISKSDAQTGETRLLLLYGCEASPADDGAENDRWAVYKFSY